MWGVFRDGIGGISWQNVGDGVGGFSGGMWGVSWWDVKGLSWWDVGCLWW